MNNQEAGDRKQEGISPFGGGAGGGFSAGADYKSVPARKR